MKVLGQYYAPAVVANSDNAPVPGAYSFDFQIPRVYKKFRPLVTIIVPNFNHADYLTQRLESIFSQTYDNFEVILLDDQSTDNSLTILSDFAARYPEKVRTIFNEVNSGGVFRQWEKGISAAKGDLIWIAESDDWASPNFLETLVPFFQNEGVQLAFTRTVFMDASGEQQIWSMEEYLHEFKPERWQHGWVETAPDIVRDVFSVANIIPNASSAIFRRFDRLDVLEIEQWRGMRTCGDWMFYLNAIRGGMLAYSPDARNYYRIHPKNTSVSSHRADQFYAEHEMVANCVHRHYHVPEENYQNLDRRLRHHWKSTRNDYSNEAFSKCFDLERIKSGPSRQPSVLMVGYGFISGGGETFPIQLANEIKRIGYEVTFLDCEQATRQEGIRSKLATDIPVISNVLDLVRIIRHFDIDVVHTHHGWSDNTVLDLLPVENPGASTVITLHGFYETVPASLLALQMPRLLERTGEIVYIADKNLTAIHQSKHAAERIFHRIDNAVSVEVLNPVPRASLGIPEQAFVLTLVSRAMHTKGWAEAIAATTRARDISGLDIHLVLIGDGEAHDAAKAAGVPAYIHLEGFQPNTQDYFATADLGFLPSRFPGESFPLVIIECLNAGTPVLASDIGEIRYMLTNDQGIAGALFPVAPDWTINVDNLAQQIADIAGDPAKLAQMRDLVPAAAARFDPGQMARRYGEVYKKTTITKPSISL